VALELAGVPVRLGERDIRLHSAKYDGALNYTWSAQVLHEDETGFVWFSPAETAFIRPTHTHPTPYDWVGICWYDRWYAIDASLVPPHAAGKAGTLHHYYCNIGAPGAWHGNTFRYVDLDLDLVVYPDGAQQLLDEDEFSDHRVRLGYPAEIIGAAEDAARDVATLARSGASPFDGLLVAYHIALHAARANSPSSVPGAPRRPA
jgi:protein associated with RNAse G/E